MDTVIFWFRQDLRLADLPGLHAAAAAGRRIIPCYVLDDDSPGQWRPGGASRWWLHHSLAALGGELRSLGSDLVLRRGGAASELHQLVRETGARAVHCSRMYEPWAQAVERDLHQTLASAGVELKRYPGALLFEPDSISTRAGDPYKVFTPFWRACLQRPAPGATLPPPAGAVLATELPEGLALDELALLPTAPNWAAGWEHHWQPGGKGARGALEGFLRRGLADYPEGRDHPARDATSRLSPHLHFGELSPRQLWHAVNAHCDALPGLDDQRYKFLSELGWREFSYHLLHHFPAITEHAFRPEFGQFPWRSDPALLQAWQRGQTGFPIVDAGMRELWQTGYMHNRVRMVVASFLTKHLLQPWQSGARWFFDTLVDADLANNSCSWQWTAGSGADASPYFRIFNPTLQSEKFDRQGEYLRRWVPELAGLPDRYLHEPARAPVDVLQRAGVRLGDNYPRPIVDHRAARAAALDAYADIKAG